MAGPRGARGYVLPSGGSRTGETLEARAPCESLTEAAFQSRCQSYLASQPCRFPRICLCSACAGEGGATSIEIQSTQEIEAGNVGHQKEEMMDVFRTAPHIKPRAKGRLPNFPGLYTNWLAIRWTKRKSLRKTTDKART